MKINRNFDPFGDRYQFDFKLCTSAKGWAQLDTKQDAPYFGNWINPVKREIASYCEGDITHTVYDDDAEFAAGLRESIDWHKERGYFIGIDCAMRAEIIEPFTRLGFAAELH